MIRNRLLDHPIYHSSPGVDFIKPFAPCADAKCAGHNVFCFIKKNYTPCASPRAYLRHTPQAMRYAPCAMPHAPNFYEGILIYYALRQLFLCHTFCAEKSFAICAPPKIESRRAQNFFVPCAMRRAPNFYEIDPWSGPVKLERHNKTRVLKKMNGADLGTTVFLLKNYEGGLLT